MLNNKIDFLSLSDSFKLHSNLLITVLSSVLDNISSQKIKEFLNNFYEKQVKENKIGVDELTNNLSKTEKSFKIDTETDKMKEEIIFGDLSKEDDLDFESFQRRILKPIKSIENMLQRMRVGNFTGEEVLSYSEIMKEHHELSKNIGSQIIAEMHQTISKGLQLIYDSKIQPDEYIIESLRACLIVIVATIKNKSVEITNYLNLAEDFSEKITRLSEDV